MKVPFASSLSRCLPQPGQNTEPRTALGSCRRAAGIPWCKLAWPPPRMNMAKKLNGNREPRTPTRYWDAGVPGGSSTCCATGLPLFVHCNP